MTGFGLGEATGMKEITSDQAARWDFGNFFVVDADGIFSGIFKKTFQETLIIPAHADARINHKVIINEEFHMYLEEVQKINSSDKGSLNQWLQGVLFALYTWNAGPVDGTDIAQSVVAIGM